MKQVDIIGPVDAALRAPLKAAVEAWAKSNSNLRRADGLTLKAGDSEVKGDLAKYDTANRITFKVVAVDGENVAQKAAKEKRERRPVQRMRDRREQGRPGAMKRPERTAAVVPTVVRRGSQQAEEDKSLRALASQFGLTLEEARAVRAGGKMPDKSAKAAATTDNGVAKRGTGGKFVKKEAPAAAPEGAAKKKAAPKKGAKEAAPKKKAARKK